MSEWRRTDEEGQPVFDDDRLLARALELDDDPELDAAAAADDELRRRLDQVRTDVAAVGVQLQAAAPQPDPEYADPMGARWAVLHEYYSVPAGPDRPRRGRRWLTVLAPVAAVAAALAVGVGVLATHGTGSSSSGTGGAATAVESNRQPATDASGQKSGWSGTAPQKGEVEVQTQRSLAKQAERFAVVVVARAGTRIGDAQRFVVVRVLKGDAPKQVTLSLVAEPAKRGALHVLFLDPVAARDVGAGQGETASPSPTASATASPSPTATGLRASPGAVAAPAGPSSGPTDGATLHAFRAMAFRYEGGKAIVRRLPPGFDLGALRLP